MWVPTVILRRAGPLETGRRILFRAASLMAMSRRERWAYARMPHPVTWDWARARVMPLLAGPYFDTPGEELVRAISAPAVTVVFGIHLGGGVLPLVDRAVGQRWECTPEQLLDAGLANVDREAARVDASALTTGTLSGYPVKILRRPAGWCSSVLLVPDHLRRIFGTDDQVFSPIAASTLIALPADTPPHVAAGIVADLERDELFPLMLDPFLMQDGELTWGGAVHLDPEDDGDWVVVE